MVSRLIGRLAIVAAGLAITGAALADDDAKTPPASSQSFYVRFLTPRMDARLTGEIAAATVLMDPAANPWTKDSQTIDRIERGAYRAAKSALKQYAMHSLQLDAWSVPLDRGQATALGALTGDSAGARLRFGISHFTPRADVSIPGAHGRVSFGLDARGRLGTSFESPTSKVSFGVTYSAPENSGSFALTRRF